MIDVKHFLKGHAAINTPLTFEEAFELGCYALEGCRGNQLAMVQSIAVICALHNRGTYAWRGWRREIEKIHGHSVPKSAAEQIAGVCAAIFCEDIGKSVFGFLAPQVPYAMDNCGMGGDSLITPNVSTIAALIAASAGIPICKHGSPSNTDRGKSGSSDFISRLGVMTYGERREVEHCLEEEGFAYTEALDTRYKLIHRQTHEQAMLPHMNDIVGPITNPLSPKILTRRVLGTNRIVPPRLVAETYQILNRQGITHLQHGIFVRGFADRDRLREIDEVSVCAGGTEVVELKNGEVREYSLEACDFGIDPVPANLVSPPRDMTKGEFSLAILRGEIGGSPLQMILANAALLFYLAGQASNFREGYMLAKETHKEGRAYAKACNVQRRLPLHHEATI